MDRFISGHYCLYYSTEAALAMKGALYIAVMCILGVGLIYYNWVRFADDKIRGIRMDKSLDYLPSPQMSKVLSFGHHNTVAKLRWIDSFTYFNYRVELTSIPEEAVEKTNGRDQFARLYESLIAADPLFLDYYLTGNSCLGGLANLVMEQMRLLQKGLWHFPDNRQLWMNFMAVLRSDWDAEERNAEVIETMLQAWSDAVADKGDAERRLPNDWLAAMARRMDRGTSQLAYWAQQIGDNPESPVSQFAIRTLREQLAAHGVRQLQALVDAYKKENGRMPEALEQCLSLDLVRTVYPHLNDAILATEPLGVAEHNGQQQITLRSDPYGYMYTLSDGGVSSPGFAMRTGDRRLNAMNFALTQRVQQENRWPHSLFDAQLMLGDKWHDPPEGMNYELQDGRIVWAHRMVTPEPWPVEHLRLIAQQ